MRHRNVSPIKLNYVKKLVSAQYHLGIHNVKMNGVEPVNVVILCSI